jgi:hypothetical protein
MIAVRRRFFGWWQESPRHLELLGPEHRRIDGNQDVCQPGVSVSWRNIAITLIAG